MTAAWWLGHIIAAAWLVAAAAWFIGSLSTKATLRRQSYLSRAQEVWPVIAGAILLYANDLSRGMLGIRFVPHSLPWLAIGAALTIAGVLIAIFARFHLGGNWSATVTVKQGHRLIRTGPYAFVRHPIYSGFLLAMLGSALYVGELRGLLGVALATLGWRRKSLHEEVFMEEEFGEEYQNYRSQVRALIPFVW